MSVVVARRPSAAAVCKYVRDTPQFGVRGGTEELHLLKPVEVAAMLRISTVTLKRWRLAETGPAFTRLSRNRVVYRRRDVLDWYYACSNRRREAKQ